MVAPLQATIGPLSTGRGSFVFRDDAGRPEKPVKVWYYKPAAFTASGRVLFVLHGTGRNAETYREHWVRHAEKYTALLIVPEFSERYFPTDEYQFGNLKDPDPARWSFAVIEHLFDALRAGDALTTERYSLYGHSAGAQFVHRYMLFMRSPRVERAVTANAGAYTLPIYAAAGQPGPPWSLDRNVVGEDRLKSVFARRMIVLLGDKDIDPNHPALPRTRQAMAQGANRLARGRYFYQTAQKEAAALSTPFNWTILTVPGVAHSDRGMAGPAAKMLFERQAAPTP